MDTISGTGFESACRGVLMAMSVRFRAVWRLGRSAEAVRPAQRLDAPPGPAPQHLGKAKGWRAAQPARWAGSAKSLSSHSSKWCRAMTRREPAFLDRSLPVRISS